MHKLIIYTSCQTETKFNWLEPYFIIRSYLISALAKIMFIVKLTEIKYKLA